MSKIIKFSGIPSGDFDSFCWDVSKEDFIKITNEEPTEDDISFSNKGLYRIYPNNFHDNKDMCNIEIKIN